MNLQLIAVLKSILVKIKILTKILNHTFFSFIAFFIYKRIQVLRKKTMKTIYMKKSVENISLINSMEPLDYVPSFFTPTYISQALYLEYSSSLKLEFKREYLINPEDNGLISIDWCISSLKGNRAAFDKLLIIVHGLAGGSEQNYVRDIIEEFRHKFQVLVIHNRGINDTPLSTPKFYHAGFVSDLKHTVEYLKLNFKFKFRFLLGVSIGANITYKFLANDRSYDNYFTGFINISNFFNQLAAMVRNANTITDYFLLQSKKGYLRKHEAIMSADKTISVKAALNSVRVRDFDNEILVRPNGFSDSEEYYTVTQSGSDIGKLINIRTLILVAKDDPIVFLYDRDYITSKF